ncbi:alcohol acetyltransferase-like protein [Phanerochaete sordida]|uniref:Alcohol acetyltransferase-like protein n=1 Tax=Phanerochaete sordida TaxID=48140 RepID=A0A9P3L7I0_9APHY|nr:alcohol acetyltransferase-like protein [Phanerochaete sordida]
MSSPSSTDVVRDAGTIERYHILLGQLGFDSGVTISGDYVSATGSALTKETLYPALHTMIREHGALGVQVRPGATSKVVPQFIRLPQVDLDSIVEFLEDDATSTDDLLRTQLERSFALDTAVPLWRVTVVKGRTVVLSFHHAIGDGQSGPALHAALLSALNRTAAAAASNIVAIAPDATLVAPVEALTNISVSPGGLVQMLQELFTPKKLRRRAWTGGRVPRTPSLAIAVRAWGLAPPQTAALLARCRARQTTLTAALHVLAVGVLARVLGAHGALRGVARIAAETPVSLRRFTGVPPVALCDQVSSVYVSPRAVPLERGAPFPWDDARAAGEVLHARVGKTRELLGMLRLLQRMGSAESYYAEKLGKPRACGLVISNLGRFPDGDAEKAGDAPWKLENVFFCQSDAVQGSAFKINVVGSPEGSTNITFAWSKDALEDSLGEELVREIKATLEALLEEPIPA